MMNVREFIIGVLQVLGIIAVSILAVAFLLFCATVGTWERTESLPALPCATEDAEGPCYWDADVRGNGTGQSFTVDALGRITYWED